MPHITVLMNLDFLRYRAATVTPVARSAILATTASGGLPQGPRRQMHGTGA